MEFLEGEIIELTTHVRDIDDGNMIVFRIWRENQDPNSHIPVDERRTTVKDGAARIHFCLSYSTGIPENDPKYFYTVHGASPKEVT